MQTLPIGIQTFQTIIEENFLYVDKTRYFYDLVKPMSAKYFLSRPRRFGKSLTISTLDALFRGKKEWFKGLWIYDSDYDWKQYPVIRFDMTRVSRYVGAELEFNQKKIVKDIGELYGVSIDERYSSDMCFAELINQLHARYEKVVVLIDEYDKPILDHITKQEEAESNREFLRSFYGVMKALDEKMRFIFLTGVTKFSKMSVFSGLNNLKDITMDTQYAGMLGYTQEELEHNFEAYIDVFSKKKKISRDVLLQEIRVWYNGFRFSKEEVTVYNPFSTLLLFDQTDFRNYWFETATPDFLIKLIKQEQYDMVGAEEEPVGEEGFSTFEIDNLNIRALLFQTGYCTIKRYEEQQGAYWLGYPNKEVEIAFTKHMLTMFAEQRKHSVSSDLIMMSDDLSKQDVSTFFERLHTFIAGIPYTVRSRDEEKYYQSLLYTILRCLGINVHVEMTTNKGRIDAVIDMPNVVYICEFKLNGRKEEALEQIKTMKYYEQFLNTKKDIILIGVDIDREHKNINTWIMEKIKS